jgi:hypothetical protein
MEMKSYRLKINSGTILNKNKLTQIVIMDQVGYESINWT